jgi:hypothetical protein
MAKPRKVEETAATYSVAKKRGKSLSTPAAGSPTTRYADEKVFRRAAEKVFKTHKELFRRLAQ